MQKQLKQKIEAALKSQGLTHSQLKDMTGATDDDLYQLVAEGFIENVGMVSEFQPLEEGEIDEPMYILSEE